MLDQLIAWGRALKALRMETSGNRRWPENESSLGIQPVLSDLLVAASLHERHPSFEVH